MSNDDLINRGITALRAGNLQEASACFARAVQQDPRSEKGWFYLGQCRINPKEKEYCYRKVLEINPANPEARRLLEKTTLAVAENIPIRPAAIRQPRPEQTTQPARKKRSPVLWVGIALAGCGLLTIVTLVIGALNGWGGYTAAMLATQTPAPTPTATQTEIVLTPTATASPTPRFNPIFVRGECSFPTPRDITVKCGLVTVLEDRNGKSDKKVKLAVAVYRSTAANPAPDPVIYIQGGPGDEALHWAAGAYTYFVDPILKTRDFVVFDQRGTGASNPALDCKEIKEVQLEDLQGTLAAGDRVRRYREAFLTCRDQFAAEGINLANYTSEPSAEDVKDVLGALGYKQANLYGISYGTYVAQVVMRRHPEIVRAAVLDSVVPLETKMVNESGTSIDYLLKTFYADCAAQPACQRNYPNFETDFKGLTSQLDTKPVSVSLQIPQLDFSVTSSVDGTSLLNDVIWAVRSPQLIPEVPRLLHQIQAGDYSILKFAEVLSTGSYQNIALGKYITVTCHDQVSATTPAELSAALGKHPATDPLALAQIFGDSNIIFDICDTWGTDPVAPGEKDPLISDIPTLILTGRYDSTTPPTFARLVASHLSRHYLYEFPDVGHAPSAQADSPCPMYMVLSFLREPASEPTHACFDRMTIPQFVTPYDGVAAIEMTDFTTSDGRVTVKIPAYWQYIGSGFWNRQNSLFDATQLGVQASPTSVSKWLQWLKTRFNGSSGFDADPVQTGSIHANGLTWTLYKATSGVYPVDLAFAQRGGWTYLVLLMTQSDEHDAMYTHVFETVIQSAKPND